MTNVSVVEKISELMQQIEVNSPRVAALHYCLSEAARHIAELEQKLAESQREFRAADATIENLQMQLNAEREVKLALATENAGLKSAFDKPQAYLSWHAIPPTWEDPLPSGEYLDVHDDAGHKNSDGTDCWPVYAKPEIETPATDAFLAEVRASSIPDEATERDLFEEWVMEKIFISKTTLEGLRTDDGYRNSTLSGTDYNGMWSQWKAIRAAKLRQEAAK